MNLENTKSIKIGNRNIVKIISGGVVLWERQYKWEKYTLNEVEWIGNLTEVAIGRDMNKLFPEYHDFRFERDGGTTSLYGRRKPTSSNKVGVVKSPYQTAYPKDGISGDYYYKLIA